MQFAGVAKVLQLHSGGLINVASFSRDLQIDQLMTF